MSWHWIGDDASLRAVLERHAGAAAVAVDTEFMRRNTFYPQVALLQLCFGGEEAWLVDPLAITDTAPIEDLLANPDLVKILHSPSEDLEVFQRWLGVLPQSLFDTQRAAALLGMDFGMGYRALVHKLCGVEVPKEETRSDWLQRPLTPAQCEYAALDVIYLLRVYRHLYAACAEAGKLEWVLADAADAVSSFADDPTAYYKRVKSAWKLDRRQLGALAAICEWREHTARQKDKPRNWIIDDRACLAIARADPVDRGHLRATAELPAPALRRYGDAILQVLEQQRSVPEDRLPPPLPAPLTGRQREQGKRLKREARAIAEQLEVAPEILLQARDYETLVREAAGNPPGELPRHWRGWRAQAVIRKLREVARAAA